MAPVALVIVGILTGGSIPLCRPRRLSLVAAGILQVMSSRGP